MQGIFRTPRDAMAHVRDSLKYAREEKSKIKPENPVAKSILDLLGMSGKCTRHLLNNLGGLPGIRYVEVGSHLGSTFCSTIFQNTAIGLAVSIDNWSQFVVDDNEVKKNFIKNVHNVAIANGSDVEGQYIIHEGNYMDVDFKRFAPIDVYFFDGPHHWTDQKQGLIRAFSALGDVAIIIVDDWNWPGPQEGTGFAFQELGLEIHFAAEIYTEPEGFVPSLSKLQMVPNRFAGSKWHNGLAVFVVKKTK